MPANPCPLPHGTYPPQICCDANGGPLTNAPKDQCSSLVAGPTLGGAPLPGPDPQRNPQDSATKALATAASLASGASVLGLGPVAKPITADATAGTTAAPVYAKSGSNSTDSGSGSGSGPTSGSHGGGSGSGSGGGSGSGFNAAGLKTSPSAPDANGTATNSSLTGAAASADGTYGAGNGGAAGGKGAYGSGNGVGGGFFTPEGNIENVVTTVDMGPTGSDGSGAGAKGDPASSDDPSDYFKRLGLGDNLFKVIERRYTAKARQWVNTDLGNKLNAAPKILK